MELTPIPPKSPLAPTEQEVALLTAQYHKAVNGLYEAYRFGVMLLLVRERLKAVQGTQDFATTSPSEARSYVKKNTENTKGFGTAEGTAEGPEGNPHESPENQASLGSLTRETTEKSHGNCAIVADWRAGTGLKAWLAEHCPEINYKTALRFLAVAEKTHAALAAQALVDREQSTVDSARQAATERLNGRADEANGHGPMDCPAHAVRPDNWFLTTVDSPSEAAVRAYLEGKSQRAVLRLGGKRAGAGRPRKDWSAALGESPLLAMKRLEEALAPLNELIVVKQAHLLLTPGDLAAVRAAIDLLHERVWDDQARRGTQD